MKLSTRCKLSHLCTLGNDRAPGRVAGFIKRQPVLVLIDSGSMHNLINETLARCLGLFIHGSTLLEVGIADGKKMPCF